MKAAEILLAVLALVVAVSAVLASGWSVLVWTFLLAAPYVMLLLASRQLLWWNEARTLVAGGGLLVSLVVATFELRGMAADTVAAGGAVMVAWLLHAATGVIAMIGAAVLTIRRVREVQRERER